MGYIQKEWVNPVTVNATELNRIEKGVKDSHENLSILNEELSNLQIKQLQNQDEIKKLLKDSPTVLESLKELESLIANNTSVLETLKDTSNLVTQNQLTKLSNSFLHITSVTQDGNNIFSNGKIKIVSPTVDTILNKTSDKAISNKAVTLALENLTSKIIIPTKLSDLKDDYHHRLITDDERKLWNTIKDISFTETDPTVPNWAKDPNKPSYEWNEILNTPTIYKHIAEFPDANQYSTTNHNHNTLYALLQHEHDNRYSYVNHKHLEYSRATHDHDSLYAAINHTHDFDLTGVQELLDKEIRDRTDQYNSILSQLGSISMDYNTLLNRPDLSIYALNSDLINHNHDSKYSLLSHNHDTRYSLLTHNHNNDYADIDHTHDYSNYFAPLQHSHDDYSLGNHNHDTRYSLLNHNHSGVYSEVTHTHDTSYSKLDHTHTEYSSASHTHDFSSVYAALSHNHDTIYSKLNHTHTEFSSIVDSASVQLMIDNSIDELINGADGTYDTLKELQTAIESNKDILTTLNNVIENKANKSHTHTKSEITDFGNYLPTSGGTLTGTVTMTGGDFLARYVGVAAAGHETSTYDKIAILSSTTNGYIRYRTKAEILSDIQALPLSGGTINASSTITMGGTTNATGAKLKWSTVNSNTPYTGFASDQTDGTFVISSLKGTNYASGLAIGGGSGNLLWKGSKVAVTSDIPTDYAKKAEGVYLVDGTGNTTAGTWSGTNNRITSYYDGLTVNFKIGVAGASTTTLNINGLGAKTCYMRGTSKITTHYAVGTMVLLTYNATTDAFYSSDYDANSSVTQTVRTTNGDFPLLLRGTSAGTTTVTTSTTFGTKFLANPSTGELKATKFTENGTTLASKYLGISANAASATKATQDGSGNVITSTYVTLSTAQTISGNKTFTGTVTVPDVTIS